jgi:hypothetical protein
MNTKKALITAGAITALAMPVMPAVASASPGPYLGWGSGKAAAAKGSRHLRSYIYNHGPWDDYSSLELRGTRVNRSTIDFTFKFDEYVTDPEDSSSYTRGLRCYDTWRVHRNPRGVEWGLRRAYWSNSYATDAQNANCWAI